MLRVDQLKRDQELSLPVPRGFHVKGFPRRGRGCRERVGASIGLDDLLGGKKRWLGEGPRVGVDVECGNTPSQLLGYLE